MDLPFFFVTILKELSFFEEKTGIGMIKFPGFVPLPLVGFVGSDNEAVPSKKKGGKMNNTNDNNTVSTIQNAVSCNGRARSAAMGLQNGPHDCVNRTPLTPLSFTTELSAADLNRLLKIVSANDMP